MGRLRLGRTRKKEQEEEEEESDRIGRRHREKEMNLCTKKKYHAMWHNIDKNVRVS